jgi:hypothetical protein
MDLLVINALKEMGLIAVILVPIVYTLCNVVNKFIGYYLFRKNPPFNSALPTTVVPISPCQYHADLVSDIKEIMKQTQEMAQDLSYIKGKIEKGK